MASSFQLPTTTTTTTSLNSEQNNIQTLPPQQNSMATNTINLANRHNNTHYNTITNGNHHHNNNNPKKRYLEYAYLSQNSPYFKMRATLTQLRPLILKAILAPTLVTCEARHGIQEKLELLVDQCRQQKTASVINCNGGSERKHLDNGKQAEQKPPQLPRVDKERRFASGNSIAKQKQENQGIPGSYIVGGSAFGWNFLMFQGTKPEYYGRTKEEFRAGL